MIPKILMRKDMSVVDGNHRLSVAIENCPDIREFMLEVDIQEDGRPNKPGILYFDKTLNRLFLKEMEAKPEQPKSLQEILNATQKERNKED